MAPDGEIGEPAYAISDSVVESKCISVNLIFFAKRLLFCVHSGNYVYYVHMSWPFVLLPICPLSSHTHWLICAKMLCLSVHSGNYAYYVRI